MKFGRSFSASRLRTSVEILTNVAIILIAVLLGTVVVKRYLLAENAPTPPSRPTVEQRKAALIGKTLPLTNIDWTKGDHNIVLALQSGCKFCTESASFYRQLTSKQLSNPNLHLIALFPTDVDSGKSYLDSIGVSISDVRSTAFSAIGISSTPTLMFVDSRGMVKDVWLGRLDSKSEEAVLKLLN